MAAAKKTKMMRSGTGVDSGTQMYSVATYKARKAKKEHPVDKELKKSGVKKSAHKLTKSILKGR